MPRKIYKPEEIVAKLRQVEVMTSPAPSRESGFVLCPESDIGACCQAL